MITESAKIILVTRPSPTGEQLVNRLRALGLVAYHAPLIRFSAGSELTKLPGLLQTMRAGDLVFILSQNVIRYVNPLLHRNIPTVLEVAFGGQGDRPMSVDIPSQQLAGFKGEGYKRLWPSELLYYAIGRRTASVFQAVSHLPVTYPNIATSEELLTMTDLQQLSGKKALLLRGNGGRELLGKILMQRGAEVSYCECYRRNPIHYDASQKINDWRRLGINTLVVTSGEMLQQLHILVSPDFCSFWLLDCRMIVVSERLAILAKQLGWHDIQVAKNADNDALIHELYPKPTTRQL
ncbi:uroporphyrinogen-III synthase [Candidatus Regiella insecticola]|uniref:Uroporphyrinogen-III synthase n=1 Tax=Candidatus Regiella insecticola TaxID=138073 RepID=A0A6L2ZPP4_9ENTR|nr:uroporphyrinogen-III synthase [Candidatus Regiella insecticola]GFN46512.1 uroporphyrinogen-III synthase [Candidatus Regiella insecticola]